MDDETRDLIRSIREAREALYGGRGFGSMPTARMMVDGLAYEPTLTEQEETISVNKNTVKAKHYSQSERESRHNPASDWVECQRGEKCVNSVTLEVADLVAQYA